MTLLLITLIIAIISIGGYIMSALSDLNTSVAQISTDVAVYIASQDGAVAASDVEAAVQSLNTLDATVKALLPQTPAAH